MLGLLYRNFAKPILFLFPADSVHVWFLGVGRFLGRFAATRALVAAAFRYENPSLKTRVSGIDFQNPVGLAAGFDYDADLPNLDAAVGFGFATVGTVTLGAYEGNPAPMLGRLPKSRALLVNKGFKSAGMEAVLAKLASQKPEVPLGLSIGSTNRPYESFEELVEEVAKGFELARGASNVSYFELNVSCPNLINIEQLPERIDAPSGLSILLDRLSRIGLTKPVFVKMPLEKTVDETLALCGVMTKFPFIAGLILSNLTKNRANPSFDAKEIAGAGKGNFSGKPTQAESNELISAVYRVYGSQLVIIGCGGIFTAEDAYEKIRRGASLVQLITGMIYMGPQQIGVINRELSKLLARDGFATLADAVGSGSK